MCSPHPQEKQRGGIRSKGELCEGGVLDGHDDPRRQAGNKVMELAGVRGEAEEGGKEGRRRRGAEEGGGGGGRRRREAEERMAVRGGTATASPRQAVLSGSA